MVKLRKKYSPLLYVALSLFGREPERVVRIITHKRPHLDEIVAIYVILFYYRSRGISIEIQFLFTGTNDLSDIRKDLREQVSGLDLYELGVGGGECDEHAFNGRPAKAGECAATLVAKLLSLYSEPSLEALLAETLKDDTGGYNKLETPYYRPKALRALYNTHDVDENHVKLLQIVWWSVAEIESLHNDEMRFLYAAPEEFEGAVRYDNLATANGNRFRLAAIRSDNPKMRDYVLRRSEKDGAGYDILVLMNSRKRVQVFSNGRFYLDEVAKEIKRLEDRVSGRGQGEARWFCFVPGNGHAAGSCSLMNGALTHPDVPATGIKLTALVELVINRMTS